MGIVAIAVVVAVWELHQGLSAKDIDIPEQPLMLGGVVMVVVAYVWGAPALVTATAVTALVDHAVAAAPRRRRLRQERHRLGLHARLRPVPRLVRRAAARPRAAPTRRSASTSTTPACAASSRSSPITVASDTGGYVAGVLFGKHPMAPVISPEEVVGGLRRLGRRHRRGRRVAGRRRSSAATGGSASILGLIAAVMATLGDLCESVIKRDLGIKDMSQVIPGHGGLMDRLDSLLATIAPIWLLLHYLVF